MLTDKFNIINNVFKNESNLELLLYKYIKEYINENNEKNMISSYIHQLVIFNNIFYSYDEINNIINKYLIEYRNKFRLNIKNNTLTIKIINTFIINIFKKIEYINYILNDKIIYNNFITNIALYILTDSIILNFIENVSLKFDKNIINDIKSYLLVIDKININYTFKIINIIKNNLIINMKSLDNIKLTNILSIYNLDTKIKYYDKLNKYYSFINFDDYICTNIIKHITDIIDNNNIKDINYIFNNLFLIINEKIKKINTYDIILNNIYNRLTSKIDEDNFNIIFTIIVKFMNNNNFIVNTTLLINKYYIDEYIDYIDNYIKNNYNNINDNHIKNILIYVNYLSNIDIFIDKYYNKLIKRLMNMYNNIKYYYIEYDIINKLTYKNTYKLNKIIKDVILSNSINNNILLVSYIWNLNNTTVDNYKGNLKYYIDNINIENKNCIILPHYGEIIIEYLNLQLIMLPIQYMILELFENNDKIAINDKNILNIIDNYDNKFKNDLINSLIISNIIINNNSYLMLNNNSNNINTNLIKCFYEYASSNYYINNENIICNNFTHIEILEANINSVLKIENLNYNILFNKIKDKIKMFDVSNTLFNDTLNKMINKDIISLNDNLYSKIFY